MIDPLLKSQLEPVARRHQTLQLWRRLALWWIIAATVGLGFVLLQRSTGWTSPNTLPILAIAGMIAALAIAVRCRRVAPNVRGLARQIEQRHPELHALLLTAVEQQTNDQQELNYLQHRVLQEAIEHSQQRKWTAAVPTSRLFWAQAAHWVALAFFVTALFGLRVSKANIPPPAVVPTSSVSVTPGDTTIERGNSLVVLARFTGPVPADVDLVIGQTPESSRRQPLVKTLADPVFGGNVPEVAEDFVYHVEYTGQRTPDFKVTVFEYPRLERADAELQYPDYTGLAKKRIENTRRLSAVEGTRLDLALQLNKPVASAQLVAKDKSVLPLAVAPNRAMAQLNQFPLQTSQTYQLQLVDAEGRTNKVPAQFVIDVLKNRTPELKLASPRGDWRPSPLEEINFSGTVWDDFGVQKYGLAYTMAGQETKFIELGQPVPGKEKRTFNYLLRLEDLAVAAGPIDLLVHLGR